MISKTKILLAVLLPLQIIGVLILAKFPAFVERWYSHGFYPFVSVLERKIFGWLPFSFGDLVYGFLIIMLVRWIFIRFKTRFKNFKVWSIDVIATLSVIYLLFLVFWGVNYYRQPLHISLAIKDTYTDEELVRLTKTLIVRSNELQEKLADSDSVSVKMPYSREELYTMAIAGYDNLKTNYPELEYRAPSVKKSLFSLALSYMGFNGYLNPLTNEAQINHRIIPYKMPTTTAHEIGHQLGYAKENEANFIACVTTMNHPDDYVKYSGYTFALKYCLNEVYRRNPSLGMDLLFEVNCGIRANYAEVRNFWLAYENTLEPFFALFYDGYLKANNQPKGMESYSYVVALLVNYFSEEKWHNSTHQYF